MAPAAFVNGELVPAAEATLSVFDHGLLVGDGVFETVLVRHGRPVLLERHLRRLEDSARGLGIAAPDAGEIAAAVDGVLAGEQLPLGRLRIICTSGRGSLGSRRRPGERSLVVLAERLDPPAPSSRVAIAPWPRNERGATAGLKTTSYAENARAIAFAAELGADEAIFGNTAGELCEGTGSNVFVVLEDGEVVTPPLRSGCLAGVTRALAIGAGALERDLALDDFRGGLVEEAFLTSTTRGVQPIAVIDGAPLARCPGPATLSIAEAVETVHAAG